MDEDSGDDVLPAMELACPVMGLTVGRVIESKHPTLVKGQLVMGRLAWEAYSIARDDFLIVLEESAVPLHYHLGILGDTGMSAYFGLNDIGKPTAQETVVISAAGGAVGYVAGQIAKIMGAKRVVGVTSSAIKGERLLTELGYDAFINHRSETIHEDIESACPQGIDVYFDNVGGPAPGSHTRSYQRSSSHTFLRSCSRLCAARTPRPEQPFSARYTFS